MCGGTRTASSRQTSVSGLSPRVRGNRRDVGSRRDVYRSIPACAGEPGAAATPSGCGGVYPRVCGGTQPALDDIHFGAGLSPRVRGNRRHLRAFHRLLRSIPACAGEPPQPIQPAGVGGVYPRVCGGTTDQTLSRLLQKGLSPRVRGNLFAYRRPARRQGSIPACAGEPSDDLDPDGDRMVYPRVCGGTLCQSNDPGPAQGLSPRVRGNPLASPALTCGKWSIPACAGEPDKGQCRAARRFRRGLSPRVRGNPAHAAFYAPEIRSIPACAGEPIRQLARAGVAMVYPRVCGGTSRKRRRH